MRVELSEQATYILKRTAYSVAITVGILALWLLFEIGVLAVGVGLHHAFGISLKSFIDAYSNGSIVLCGFFGTCLVGGICNYPFSKPVKKIDSHK